MRLQINGPSTIIILYRKLEDTSAALCYLYSSIRHAGPNFFQYKKIIFGGDVVII